MTRDVLLLDISIGKEFIHNGTRFLRLGEDVLQVVGGTERYRYVNTIQLEGEECGSFHHLTGDTIVQQCV